MRLNLLGGTYLTRSPVGSVERCVNLYPERNPQQQGQGSAPFTDYLTPGLTFRSAPLVPAVARGLYTATNGSLYYVSGSTAYLIDQNINLNGLGTLLSSGPGLAFMQDNGNVLVIVDGTTSGYAINLQAGITGKPLSFTVNNAGTGGTAGNYTVPLVGGSGTGATATVTVAGGAVIIISITGGLNYALNDVCTLGSAVPGLTSFQLTLTAVGAAPNTFAVINEPNFLGGTGIGYADTFLVFSQPNSRNFYSSLSNVTFAQLTSGTSGQPQLGAIIAAGTGGTNGTYTNQALTGGAGTGATATVTVAGGAVTSVVLNGTGSGYLAGDVLSATITGLSGFQFSLAQVSPAAFNALAIAAKTGYPDLLSTLVTVHREVWLMGAFESAEVWFDAGAFPMPFQIMPGIFIQHGCIAPASVATHDLDVFWLGVDNAGQGTVFMGTGYRAQRISTWAIANIISGYLKTAGTISDAVGLVYKQQDHVFYVLSFPSANATLVYDRTEGLWHERTWTDPVNGTQNRVRYNCAAQAYGFNIVGDWQNGNVYVLDLNAFTDNGVPIVRYRSFCHLLNDGKRQSYDRLAIDLQAGQGIVPAPQQAALLSLLISDDRGVTFRATPAQSFGAVGQYLVQSMWHQLGIARDRVFAVTWSDGAFTALQGAWLDVTPAET